MRRPGGFNSTLQIGHGSNKGVGIPCAGYIGRYPALLRFTGQKIFKMIRLSFWKVNILAQRGFNSSFISLPFHKRILVLDAKIMSVIGIDKCAYGLILIVKNDDGPGRSKSHLFRMLDRKSTRMNSSHKCATRMPSS